MSSSLAAGLPEKLVYDQETTVGLQRLGQKWPCGPAWLSWDTLGEASCPVRSPTILRTTVTTETEQVTCRCSYWKAWPSQLLAGINCHLKWGLWDAQLSRAFTWLYPQLAFDRKHMRDPKLELPCRALPQTPSPQNPKQNQIAVSSLFCKNYYLCPLKSWPN